MSDPIYAQTWYDENSIKPPKPSDFSEKLNKYDFAVIGGGLAGLVLSLKLSQGGATVAVFESKTIGSGASGRNGGFCSTGWAASPIKIKKTLGLEKAELFEDLGVRGFEWMKKQVSKPRYQKVNAKYGELNLSLSNFENKKDESSLSPHDLERYLVSSRYKFGSINEESFQFNPLSFMRILMEECLENGVHIFENCSVLKVERSQATNSFELLTKKCQKFITEKVTYATGGYGGLCASELDRVLLPIKTFVAVTDPLPGILKKHIRTEFMISDNRRAGNYYRLLDEERLLWGMGISALGNKSISKIKRDAFRDLKSHFPKLVEEINALGLTFQYVWSGLMGYSRNFLPYVGELSPNRYAVAGFGGHGMNTAPISAICLSEFLLGNKDSLNGFDEIMHLPHYGNVGKVAAEIIYKYLSMKDFISEYKPIILKYDR
jgi:gamma-glutamylputrescine oxidase